MRALRALRRLVPLVALTAGTAAAQPATLFQQVRVFDGTRSLGTRDVLVRDGRIAAIAPRLDAPAGTARVDGAGKTLLPGLIDAHVHAWGDAPRTALVFGVTTELDMFSDVKQAATWRAEQRSGVATRADVLSAGTLVTAPKGHGTEYGMPIPTIASPDSAQAFVDARIAEGSDWIKIVYDDGHTYGMSTPTLDVATMRAVIAAAHRRGKLAVVHIGDLAGARAAIDAGADGLAHLFVDRAPDAAFARFAAQHHVFVVPTLTVLSSVSGTPGGAPLVRDARLASYIPPTDVSALAQAFPRRAGAPATSFAAAQQTVRALAGARVPLLAGTDAGNPGTSHGAALHRELELLVEAGLTPTAALAAATRAPADAFHLADRGRIAVGARADLLLVTGDPTTDVTATRAIAGVWKGGVPVDRAAFAREVAAQRDAAARPGAAVAPGLVSDFESGAPRVAFGAGWAPTNDAMRGGGSQATMDIVSGGAHGSAYALGVRGTISDALPFAWAGVMLSPAPQPFQPANLSAAKAIRFWARGDGQPCRVMLFAQSRGYMPLERTFTPTAEWQEFTFPLAAFDGIDGHDVMAILIAGGPRPGPFAFQLDDVRIQ